jgi:hypothetical protein
VRQEAQLFWPARAPFSTILFQSPKEIPMPHRALAKISLFSLVLVSLAMAVGCGKSPADRLAGKWVGDRIDNVSADDVARATGWVKGTSFEFAGDKVTVTIPAEPARKGTFKVAKAEGEKMTLAVTHSDDAAKSPASPTPDLATMTMLNEKTMSWDIGDSREIVLVRVQ